MPDVAFVRMERLPGGKSPKGFSHFPPDLAVEVFDPGETVADYAEKLTVQDELSGEDVVPGFTGRVTELFE